MPGRISYNGIFIDFINEWVRFNPLLVSNTSSRQFQSGIKEHLKFFEQDFISTEIRLAPGQDQIQLQRFFEYANDGSTFELWRDPNLGAYISFEGGGNSATVPTITPRGLQTNDKVAGTFTQTAVADSSYFLDPSTGLMTVVPTTNHIPRFEAGKYGQHAIRIEGARTNLLTVPSDMTHADWTGSLGITPAKDTSETKDIMGTNLFSKLTATSESGLMRYDTSTAISTNDGVFSVYLKSQSATVAGKIRISSTTAGQLTGKNISVVPNGPESEGYTRFNVVHNSSGSVADNWRIEVEIDTNTEIMYGGAAQIEAGAADLLFPSNPIGIVSTSSVARGADKLLFASANIVNRDKGTIAFWVKPSYDAGENGTNLLFRSGASDANAHVDINPQSDGTIACHVHRNNGTSRDTLNISGSFLTADTWHHIALTYDSTISNGVKFYANGSLTGTITNSAYNASDVSTNFVIGSGLIDSGNQAFALFDEFLIMQDVKSAAWVQQIFSRTQAIGEGRNYWSSVRLANLNYVRQALRGGRSTIPLEFEEVIT